METLKELTKNIKGKNKKLFDYLSDKVAFVGHFTIDEKLGSVENGKLNCVRTSIDIKEKSVWIVNPKNGCFEEVDFIYDEKIDKEFLKISRWLYLVLGFNDNDKEIILFSKEGIKYNNVLKQKIENIASEKIVISTNSPMAKYLKDKKYDSFKLYNEKSKENIIVPRKNIVMEEMKQNEIRMSMIQRKFLRVGEVPLFLTKREVEEICKNPDTNVIKENYGCIKEIEDINNLIDDAKHDDKEKITELFKKYIGYNLTFIPAIESYKKLRKNIFKRFFTKIGKWFMKFCINNNSLSLRCVRPHGSDDTRRIIRVSSLNLKLLGLDDMDRALVTYKNKSIKCTVSILEEKEMLKENVKCDMETVIGIPSNLRSELKIPNLKSNVKIERDMLFLLKKNSGTQVVSLLAALLSAILFTDEEKKISALITLLCVPFLAYFSLAGVRNKVPKKPKESKMFKKNK